MQLHGNISNALPQSHHPWGSALVYTPPLHVRHSQASVPCPGKMEQKQQLIGAYLLRLGRGIAAGVCRSCLLLWGLAGSCNRLWRICSGGSPSQFPQRQELACGVGGRPTHCVPLNNGTSISRQTMLPLGAFPAEHPLTLVSSAVSTQPTALLSPDPFSQPHALALRPCQHQRTLIPGMGTQGCFPRRFWDGQHSHPWSLHGRRRPWPKGQEGLLRSETLPVPSEAKEARGWGDRL